MTSCDVCVRVFYQSRAEWKRKLIEQFDEDMVLEFLRVIDGQSLKRIQQGLVEAYQVLRDADSKRRGVRILPTEATYAFFEALSCDAMVRDEEALQRYFDMPFDLVQVNKRLKLQTFLPAMTRFLFTRNERRQRWSFLSWSTFKRNILKSEFDWAVRNHLVDAMMRVQMTNLDLPFVASYWAGVKLIVDKLDKELITTSIRGLEGDFYRLLLDHLSLDSEGFLDLVATMTIILVKSPTDFWDAMDAITPSTATIVEQVFNSPVLKQMLLAATEENQDLMANLQYAFEWITPFLNSIKPTNLPPAVRAFANALLGRLQSDQYSQIARAYCFKEGVRVLEYAFSYMCKGNKETSFVGQPTVNSMLDILSSHIQLVTTTLKQLHSHETRGGRILTRTMIQHAFSLEAISLSMERQLISTNKPSPTETPTSSPIWKTVVTAIDAENFDLATHLLIAGRNLIGIEPLSMKVGFEKTPPTIKHFNSRFEVLSKSITDVVDRLAELNPKQLDKLFQEPTAASAIVSLLFSSTEDTRSSSVELLKVITDQEERRDALQHILRMHYKNVLIGISNSCRQVVSNKIFAPAPSIIRTCSDIVEGLCNSQDGILRSRQFDSGEAEVTMNFWKTLWYSLKVFFKTTEDWSNLGFYNKEMMMNFCRDVMQFAESLFDQCSIFASALKTTWKEDKDNFSDNEMLKELLRFPADTMEEAKKWLRLRDEFLSSTCVSLIGKLLTRLHEVSIEVGPLTLQYMEDVLTGKIKAKLSMQHQARLQRALETHLGHPLIKEEDELVRDQRQSSLNKWIAPTGASKETATKPSVGSITPAMKAFKEKQEAIKTKEAQILKQRKTDEAKSAAQSEFKRKRQLELERQKKEKEAAIAKARQARGLSTVTSEAGSGLEGLGILGKDSAPKGEGLMHSSDESDNEGDFDAELFGIRNNKANVGPRTNIINEVKIQMPVRKRRVQRSAKDMRARLAPDLSPLHKIILGWDYFHNGDFPPRSKDNYAAVPNSFRTPNDYQATFRPLLTLEAWQGFVKAREENQAKPYEIRITMRSTVDAFMEVGSTMTHAENRDILVSEGDIVLLSKSKNPSAQDAHCLARVFRIQRKQMHMEVAYRVMPSNPLATALNPNNMVFGTKIQSITPLEREYGALLGLQYYDLCDEIIRAKPSPLLTYKDNQIDPLVDNYNLNKAQAKAVKSAMDNDAFTLIQGYVCIYVVRPAVLIILSPPGSGKTKTITAIVGAILSDSIKNPGTRISVPGQSGSDNTSKKLLVCAPSNAAVDELVMRFKNGIKTLDGYERKVSIVRLGRSDAINANVQDVTLEELVSRKLGVSTTNGKDSEATRKLFEEHKNVSAQLNQVREQMDSGEMKGEALKKITEDFHALRRQKALLGRKIDDTKDSEKTAHRTAEINRRRAQEEILRDAHIICATLSGSGHEMFQGLSVEFETVIVDEAAQCVEMSALIPLKYGCAKCILVGDPKQLPPTVFSKEAARFQYEQSLFVRMQKNHPDDVHLLDTQYRMHPEISSFPSETFYDGKLLDGGDMSALRKQPWHKSRLLGPYHFFDVQGQHQAAPKGHSLVNIAEINIALQLYQRLTSDYPDYDFRRRVGIITPYKSQLRELKARFTMQYGASIVEDIDFNTTDAFQGREAEVIIFSCVRASPTGGIGFLQDIRRMNVGLTRAKSSLWVLGNSQSLSRGEFWRKLVEDARRRERYTEGDLLKMLNKPSSAYPAKPGMFDIAPRLAPKEVKSEPMSRSSSNESSNSSASGKPFIKQETNQNGGLKRTHEYSSDIEMEDADSAVDGSGTTTPASLAHGNQSSTPEVPVLPPGDAMSAVAMAKPKIRKKPRTAPGPLITRPPKKPRNG